MLQHVVADANGTLSQIFSITQPIDLPLQNTVTRYILYYRPAFFSPLFLIAKTPSLLYIYHNGKCTVEFFTFSPNCILSFYLDIPHQFSTPCLR